MREGACCCESAQWYHIEEVKGSYEVVGRAIMRAVWEALVREIGVVLAQ